MDNKTNKELIIDAFKKKPKLFLNLIIQFYPIDHVIHEKILKLDKKYIFDKLSKNKKIDWNDLNIELFKKNIRWDYLSKNKKVNWNINLLEKYQNEICWSSISLNKNIHWTEETLDFYKDKLNWKYLSKSKSINWSSNLIEKYKDRWDWFELSRNESIPWSKEIIENFDKKWKWIEVIVKNQTYTTKETNEKSYWHWSCLSLNKKIPWSIELIELFQNNWNWDNLSDNKGIPWSLELITKFENKWNWHNLSLNNKINWEKKLIEKFDIYLTNELKELIYNRKTKNKLQKNNYCEEQITNFNVDFSILNLRKTKIILSPNFINENSKLLISNKNIWNNVKFYIDDDTINKILEFDEIKSYEEHNIDPWEGQDYDEYLRQEMNYTIEDSYKDGGGGDEWSDPEDFWG